MKGLERFSLLCLQKKPRRTHEPPGLLVTRYGRGNALERVPTRTSYPYRRLEDGKKTHWIAAKRIDQAKNGKPRPASKRA